MLTFRINVEVLINQPNDLDDDLALAESIALAISAMLPPSAIVLVSPPEAVIGPEDLKHGSPK